MEITAGVPKVFEFTGLKPGITYVATFEKIDRDKGAVPTLRRAATTGQVDAGTCDMTLK